MQKINKFIYTFRHKIAFIVTEYNLTGKITLRGILHDSDKLLLYLIPGISLQFITNFHRKRSCHHFNNKQKTQKDYIQMIIDWECARMTKSDKPLNARDTLNTYFPQLKYEIEPLLKILNL